MLLVIKSGRWRLIFVAAVVVLKMISRILYNAKNINALARHFPAAAGNSVSCTYRYPVKPGDSQL
jgi:hypothetical protein